MVEKTKLSIDDLNFWYGEKQILYSVSLSVFDKKITALIGPSGCGKSTLLRTLNRMNDLIKNSRVEGKIFYEEQEIYDKDYDVTLLRKKIGMVFQKPNPFPMSIFENAAYGLRLQGMKEKTRVEEIVVESLKKADLWEEVKERLQVSAFSLSGGQQQRLCIARALAIKPDIILLDEPCSALDPISTAKIEKLLVKLRDEHTIVIVTHNMHQAKRISDFTCYLLNGRMIEFDTTEKIFSEARNASTREYVRGEFG